ncbi:hypothetical protein MZM54_01035 [[Brevibacterium] frigoritolerans]|nr:hypothetical protein [Peribacillus frigoritolerans]
MELEIYKRGQKLKHPHYGTCYYFGKTGRGLAIIEVYKKNKFIDRYPVKFSNLTSLDE